MKDEIKEIIRLNCEEEIDVKYFAKDNSLVDTTMDYSQLLDYITNLQEENEKLKELCDKYEEEHSTTFNEWKETITDKYQTLKDLQEEIQDLRQQLDKYKNVIDKIKEYIGNPLDNYWEEEAKYILELLEEINE